MEYTLEKLLNDGILNWWKPVTEGIDYGSIVIRSISVQELPMAPFITPGEVTLTIAHGAEEDPDIIRHIVEEAGSSGAAAVFFAFDDDRKRITKDVKEYAEQIGLPLILIDFQQKFADIQEKVNRAIWSLEVAPYTRLQSDLFNAYFNGASLEEAASLIASSIHIPLAVADTYGEILTQTEDFVQGAGSISIEVSGMRFGELILESDEFLRDKKEILKQYISFPITLWFNQQRIEMITDARMVNDYALRLSKDGLSDAMKREAGFLGIDLSKRYRAVIMQPVTNDLNQKMSFVRNTYDIIQRALKAGESEHLTVICGAEAERLVAFVECPFSDSSATIERFIDRWSSDLKRILPVPAAHFGVSREFNGNDGFQDAYSEALLSVSYCDGEEDKIIYYEDARKIRIMAAVSSLEPIRLDAAGLLSGLIEYDKGNGSMELLKTLETYIKTNYNVSETARQLCIHRQSLLARLLKIEDMTGLSLKDHDDLFVLEVYSRLFANY